MVCIGGKKKKRKRKNKQNGQDGVPNPEEAQNVFDFLNATIGTSSKQQSIFNAPSEGTTMLHLLPPPPSLAPVF